MAKITYIYGPPSLDMLAMRLPSKAAAIIMYCPSDAATIAEIASSYDHIVLFAKCPPDDVNLHMDFIFKLPDDFDKVMDHLFSLEEK